MKVYEIDDVPQANAVDDIAYRAAKHQGKAGRKQGMRAAGQLEQPNRNADADHNGEADEYPALPTGCRGEKAEGGADIVHTSDIQNGQDLRELKFEVMTSDIRLADLVRQNHERRYQQPRRRSAAILFYGHAN
jgi:hypothetical protein